MKSKKFNKKLALNRRTVANLNKREMGTAHGGLDSVPPQCLTNATNCLLTDCATECPGCPLPPTSADIGCLTYESTCVRYTCGCY